MLLTFGAVVSGMTVWWEMRVSSRMQSRIGYNRVGAGGFFQWIADAVKLLLKEDLIPAEADRLLFRAAPYFVLTGFALTFVALPFGESLIAADLNVGIFYMIAVTALVVVGILLAGWSSNSKWALFGGMRSAAQVISYEIPAGLAIMVPVLMAGTLSMQGIIRAQGAWPWQWFVFTNPAALVAFVIFFIAQLAEGNRTPFDLPEAESELVAGYLSEYSAFRFALFFLVEFGNLWVMAAVAVTLFFGGWQVPFADAGGLRGGEGHGRAPRPRRGGGCRSRRMVVFVVKTLLVLNLVVWIRWTLPRIRVDQMMNLCWKYLVPVAFATFVATLLWQILRRARAAGVDRRRGVVADRRGGGGAFFHPPDAAEHHRGRRPRRPHQLVTERGTPCHRPTASTPAPSGTPSSPSGTACRSRSRTCSAGRSRSSTRTARRCRCATCCRRATAASSRWTPRSAPAARPASAPARSTASRSRWRRTRRTRSSASSRSSTSTRRSACSAASAWSPARPAPSSTPASSRASQRHIRNLVFRWSDPMNPFPVYKVDKNAEYYPRVPLGSLVRARLEALAWDRPAPVFLPPEPPGAAEAGRAAQGRRRGRRRSRPRRPRRPRRRPRPTNGAPAGDASPPARSRSAPRSARAPPRPRRRPRRREGPPAKAPAAEQVAAEPAVTPNPETK